MVYKIVYGNIGNCKQLFQTGKNWFYCEWQFSPVNILAVLMDQTIVREYVFYVFLENSKNATFYVF